uniref:Putative rabx6 n=1 Tax=Ixodes ricinus TaxID=34613 RepID=V5I0A3_IXORI
MASTKLPEQKVILCGEYGVGKSSLFRRFTTNSFVASSDRSSTLGLDHYDKVYKVAGRDLKLQLWDTGAMERVASITSSYYKFCRSGPCWCSALTIRTPSTSSPSTCWTL